MNPTPPEWLKDFADAVVRYLVPAGAMPPVGCHYAQEDEQWEVTLFAAATEVIGGRRDGARRPSCFSVDVLRVAQHFDDVHLIEWQAHPVDIDDELGAHLSIEGNCSGHSVWLRILAEAPARFSAGRYARVNEQLWEEAW